MLHGTRAKRRFILSVIVPADGTSAATYETETSVRRRFLGSSRTSTAACQLLVMWGVGRKEQWRVEKLRADLIR
jgi:hypothetical protein